LTTNRRQGCSIISARNVWFDIALSAIPGGPLPEAGVDIEREGEDEYAQNINFNKCRFVNNHGQGLSLALYPYAIYFYRCICEWK
jgi:hypothetical protein